MNRLYKQILSLTVVLVMVFSMIPVPAMSAADTAVFMHYDDRLAITELGGTASSSVEITDQTVNSSDSAVLTYVDGQLIATGIGTATVTVDGNVHQVTVSAAPISLVMITGHSIGSGQGGVAAQSIKCEAGQVYSTHGTGLASASAAGVGLGYAAASRPAGVDAFTTGGGTIGEASGIAYRWNQLTGEKVWVLNCAVGGTSLYRWIQGADCYTSAVAVYKYAQAVLANEVAAGHYILKNQAIIYHSAANWGYKPEVNGAWSNTEGEGWYESMLEGFRSELGVEAIGFVPTYSTSTMNAYKYDRSANFFMAANKAYPDVFMASLVARTWRRDITTFPSIDYTTQSQPVTMPATQTDLQAADGTHFSQVAYNAMGMEIASNLYGNLRGDKTVQSVTFHKADTTTYGDEVVLEIGESFSIVPEVSPIYVNDLTFTLSSNLSMTYPMTITGTADGMGSVTVSQNGVTVKTLNVAVGDTSVTVKPSFPEGWSVEYHCVCGNPNTTGNPCAQGGHTPVEWKPWTISNTVPFLDGYWYLPQDLNLTSATDYKYYTGFATTTGVIGRKETVDASADSLVGAPVHVYVDLNGKTVTGKSNHRIYRIENDAAHSLTICDTAGDGQLVAKSSATNTNTGMVIWSRAASNHVTVYGGILDASAATVYAATGAAKGAAINNVGILDIYGGRIIGGTVNGIAGQSQGGTIFNDTKGVLNIHGGTVVGGLAQSKTAQGGNIRNLGKLNIYGGTITGGSTGTASTNSQGGNISNVGTFYMEGGTIIGGTSVDTNGGNGGALFTTKGGTMKGGTIKNGIATVGDTAAANYRGGCVFLYGGTFTMSGNATVKGGTAWEGGNFYVTANASLVMDGGTISGGLAALSTGAVSQQTINDTKYSPYGGNIYTLGTVTVNDGLVTNSARDTNNAWSGSGIYVGSGGNAVINGGVIVSGKTLDLGGAIGTHGGTITVGGGVLTGKVYADGTPVKDPADAHAEGVLDACSSAGAVIGSWGGTVNIHGGTIIAGYAGGAGGSAISAHGGTQLNISGGLITGGNGSRTEPLYGGMISVYGVGSLLTMTGGTVTDAIDTKGAIFVRNGGAITLSGDVVIDGNYHPAGSTCNILLSNASSTDSTYTTQITIGEGGMGENAKVGVSMVTPGVFTTNAADASSFCGDSGYYVATNEDGTLRLNTHSGEGHCICGGTYDGCDHTALEGEWLPWDGSSNISEGGNYYLTQSITDSKQRWMGGTYQNTTPMTINLCLNGHSIESVNRVFGIAPYVTFNLMNCHEAESVLSGSSTTGNPGRVVHIHANSSTMNMYGNITLKGIEKDTVVLEAAGVIHCNGTFHMYGGTLIGTWVGGMKEADGTYTAYAGNGGVVRINGGGKFYLHGGTIYGGSGGRNGSTGVTDGASGKYTARSLGGVAYMNANSQFHMYGGTVYGGSVADGGVIYGKGSNILVNITGGTMYAGDAAFGGGAIKLSDGGLLTMTGGVIDGINPERPRDIRNAGSAGGGAIYLWNSDAVIKGDAIIRNCYTSNYGGAVKVATATSTLTLGGSVQLIGNGTGNVNDSTPDDVYLAAGSQILLDGLTGKAQVGIKMAAPGVFVAAGAAEELASVFIPNDEAFRVRCSNGSLILGGAPVVAGGSGYDSLTEALAKVAAGQLVTLNEDQTGNVTIPVSLYLDLNSYHIEGNVTVADGAVLSLIDSATADYTAANRGKITGTVTGEIARFFNTPAAYGHNYKYLVIREEDGYSSHRVYLTVGSAVLNPYSKQKNVITTALNYKTVFKCNEVVAEYITGYGLKLTGDNAVYAASSSQLSCGADQLNAFTTKLDGVMKSTNTVEQNNANANAPVAACAYIQLSDGLECTSASVSKTLKEVVAAANTCNTLTDGQQYALGKMYEAFQDTMDTWTDIFFGRIRICYAEKVLGQPIVADKHIALTFDDGPNLNNSMQDVMNILDSYDQKATFFLIGHLINDSTAPVVKDAYDRGFELGNHSYSHTKLTEMTVEEAVADWQKCQDLVEAITGEAPTFFRYPNNALTQDLLDAINVPSVRGYGANDYVSGVTSEEIAQRIIAGAADGNVILLHVSRGYDWTEQALHTIIPELRSLGYEITTVGGLFEAQGVEPYTGEYIYNVPKAQ